jgi:twitching motility protein PilT
MAELTPPDLRGELTLDGLIKYAADHNASDLFLKAGVPPGFRILGRIVKAPMPALTEQDTKRLAYEHLNDGQRQKFERDMEMNVSFTVPNVARIRQNIYRERGDVATTCRLISLRVKSLEEIGVHSEAIKKMTHAINGLVLVTGPTGSGKTTTLAAMIDHINENRPVNIITQEDPIEYVYTDKMAMVSQREIGIDSHSFDEALRQVLRQTPDVILIGEMRDLETLNVALQAAETGHLVFGTLHTSSAAETLDRISNMYAPHERPMLWLRLSTTLRGVISQKLICRADNSGRVVAQEIMVVTPTISKMIEEGKSSDLYTAIRQGGQEDYWGMQTMNQCLEKLVAEDIITEDDALEKAGVLSELKQTLRRSLNLRMTA